MPGSASLEGAGAPRRNVVPQILDAAERAFAVQGFSGTRVEDIARACDLPKANVLYYFGSKEELYRAALLRVLELWLADADAWLVAEAEPRAAIGAYLRAKMAFSESRPEASSLFSQELLSGARVVRGFLEGELREHVARRAAIFREWQREGLMAPVDPVHFLFMLWSMTQAYADMRVQLQAVLGTRELGPADYATGLETIMTLVCAVFPTPSPSRAGNVSAGDRKRAPKGSPRTTHSSARPEEEGGTPPKGRRPRRG